MLYIPVLAVVIGILGLTADLILRRPFAWAAVATYLLLGAVLAGAIHIGRTCRL